MLFRSGASDIIQALPMNSARIVYASSSGYTDSFEKAESSLYEAMKNTRNASTTSSVVPEVIKVLLSVSVILKLIISS